MQNPGACLLSSVLLAASLASCESALSDVEVDDPSLLQIHGQVRFVQETGFLAKEIEVIVSDKNGQPLELKNGSLAVNGTTMELEDFLLPSYLLEEGDLEITTDTEYTLEVTLANGDVHTGSVRTQPQLLASIAAPSTHDPAQDLAIGWTGANPDLATLVEVMVVRTLPDGSTPSATQTYTPTGTALLIPAADLQVEGLAGHRATISVTQAKPGTISSAFRSGSFDSESRVVREVALASGSASALLYLYVEVY